MISEFERRLADVLGPRLPAPFTGRVDVPPGTLPGGKPVILVGVTHVEPVERYMGSQHPEIVPGANDPRRVLRLICDVSIQVFPGPSQGRPQQMLGLDAVLYALDAPEFRDGTALAGPADPGFLIQSLQAVDGAAVLDPSAPDAVPPGLTLKADGWFWPVGVPGQAGVAIGEIRIRGVIYPLEISPPQPLLTAGGAPVDLTVRVGSFDPIRVHELPLPELLFGSLAFVVLGPGGRPGKGTLVDSVDGLRLVPLVDNQAVVTYQPPDEPARDELVVGLDNGADGLGIEIGRFPLNVQGA